MGKQAILALLGLAVLAPASVALRVSPVGARRLSYLSAPRARAPVDGRPSAVIAPRRHAAVTAPRMGLFSSPIVTKPLVAALAISVTLIVRKMLLTPSRAYENSSDRNSVADEYDAWTKEEILEYYWGEHIHLGYYEKEDRAKGMVSAFRKDFKGAKLDFIDRMMEWGGLPGFQGAPDSYGRMPFKMQVLDVGCGIGGTSRHLAKKLGSRADVTGITISPAQVERATQLARFQGVQNAKFELVDAMNMKYPDNSFDVVWACESGEHMPDKAQYVSEMARVLKPGGKLIMCTWCERDERIGGPFTPTEREILDFLYAEWTHPMFISIEKYKEIMQMKGLSDVGVDDWNEETRPSWRHSIWVGIADPWPVVKRPHIWWKTIRDAWTLERMHRAFKRGLMRYGMFRATKPLNVQPGYPAQQAVATPQLISTSFDAQQDDVHKTSPF